MTLSVVSAMSAVALSGAHWLRLGRVEEIGVGQGRCFKVDDIQIAVFRPCGSELRAISAVCPHRAGRLAQGSRRLYYRYLSVSRLQVLTG